MYEANAGGKETPGLEDYLVAIRNRKWLVLACALIGVGLALLYIESRTATYSAEAKVIVAKSGIVHAVTCKAGPSVKNGTFFKSVKQAAKFKFTKHHSCVAKMDDK